MSYDPAIRNNTCNYLGRVKDLNQQTFQGKELKNFQAGR